MERKQCSNCKYYYSSKVYQIIPKKSGNLSPIEIKELGKSECRRYPPKKVYGVKTEEERADLFPFVYPESWCGEYKSRGDEE